MPNRVVGCCRVQEDSTLKTILDVCGECCYLDTRAPTSTEPWLTECSDMSRHCQFCIKNDTKVTCIIHECQTWQLYDGKVHLMECRLQSAEFWKHAICGIISAKKRAEFGVLCGTKIGGKCYNRGGGRHRPSMAVTVPPPPWPQQLLTCCWS